MLNPRWHPPILEHVTRALPTLVASVLTAALLAGGTGPLPVANAQQPGSKIQDKFRTGDTVVVAADETVPHDLYAAGGTIRIDGRVDGDLFVGGGTIDISGPVTGDVFVGGGTVTVSGPVGRHLRVGAGTVTVSGPLED